MDFVPETPSVMLKDGARPLGERGSVPRIFEL